MIKTLLRLQAAQWMGLLMGVTRRRKRSRLGPAAYVGVLVLLAASFGVMFAGMFSVLAAWLHPLGLDRLYFAMFAAAGLVMLLITGILGAKNVLFDARDNQLLLSLPIRHSMILGTRMAGLVVMNFLTLLPRKNFLKNSQIVIVRV